MRKEAINLVRRVSLLSLPWRERVRERGRERPWYGLITCVLNSFHGSLFGERGWQEIIIYFILNLLHNENEWSKECGLAQQLKQSPSTNVSWVSFHSGQHMWLAFIAGFRLILCYARPFSEYPGLPLLEIAKLTFSLIVGYDAMYLNCLQ